MLPVLKQRGFRAVLPRFYFPPPGEEKQLLCGFAPTLGQTRSGTGDAHASGQDLPLTRHVEVLAHVLPAGAPPRPPRHLRRVAGACCHAQAP
jgi:hypothetical protein